MSTQLTYRGIAYQSQVETVETIQTQQFVQYRGSRYSIRRPVNVHQPESQNLKYRGIAYNTGKATIPSSQHNQVAVGIIPAFS